MFLVYQKYYDEKKIKLRALNLVYSNYQDWTEEEKRAAANSEEWLDTARKSLVVEDFIEKIKKVDCGMANYAYYEEMAYDIANDMPQELWPNVEEWIDDKTISNIKVHDISIPDIMHQFPGEDISFLDAIRCIAWWKKYDYPEGNFCAAFFMRM